MSTFRQQIVDHSHPDFTIGFLLDKLGNEQLGAHGQAGIRDAHAEQLSTGGFISDIYRVTVEFRDGAQAPFSCIFKVPTLQKLDAAVTYDVETYAEITEWCFRVHNTECRFYAEVAGLIQNAPIPLPFRLPKVYASRPCPSKECVVGGYLLMQDLCAMAQNGGIGQVELAEGLNKEQVEAVINALAHYHAICLWLPQELVDSFMLTTDLNFEDHKLHILDRLMGMPDARAAFEQWEDALRALYMRAGFLQPNEHTKFEIAPVITHGDFWSNNLFFERNDNGTMGGRLDAVFDWQIAYSGTGINDLVRLIYVCVDPEMRRAHFNNWLCLYTDVFNLALDKMEGYKDINKDKRMEQQQLMKRRPLELVKRMAKWHSEYELCFQIFLITNILSNEQTEGKRQKLLWRMKELFEDCHSDFCKNIDNK